MARVGIILSLVCALSFGLSAQSSSPVGIPVNSATIPIPLGFIDPLSTQVHLEIPIASVPQRNAPPSTATLVYDPIACYPSPTWTCGYGTGWQLKMVPISSTVLAMGTFGYSVWTSSTCPDQAYPYGSIANVYDIRFTDLHGTVHHTGSGSTTPQLTWIACHDAQGNQDPNTGTLHHWAGFSSDGAGYSFDVSYDSTGNLLSEVWSADGTVVEHLLSVSYGWVGSTNGNNFFGPFTQSPITVDNVTCLPSAPSHVYVMASDGSRQTYTINCQYYSISLGTSTTTQLWISSLVLPDGTQYSFSYDTGTSGTHLGGLTSVTLPTRGQLQFSYAAPTGCYWLYGFNRTCAPLASATFEGGTWQLGSVTSGTGNGTQTTVTVTSPPRYDAVSKSYVNDKTVYTSVPGSAPPHIQTIQHYSGPSSLFKTVGFTYPLAYGGGCVSSVSTTLNDTGQSSQIQYQYLNWSLSTFCSLVAQKQEYDFGASTPTRTTKISYQGDTSTIHYNSQYRMFNRPASVSVYAGSGTGSPISKTNYTYDEYGANYCKNSVPMLTNITGAINHDDAGHGYGFWARGNVTSISKLISGTTYVTSHICYDTLGNATQQVDELGNATNYDYTENWADTSCIGSGTLTRAFPTTITDALGHRTRTTRYTCTGLASAEADENDLDASPVRSGVTYSYDWANRPLCTNYPDGGQNCTSYFPAAQPPYFTQTTLLTSGLSKATTTIMDGYSRTSQTQLTSDPDGVDYTDIVYDALGRTASVSNPYRTTSDSTYGVTRSYYDALGRAQLVVKPDGSAVTTSYSGNIMAVTDESGKKRQTYADGLGRMTQIVEDPSGLNYETDYAYDVLNNLATVTQKGGSPSSSWRTRTFTYDSLSRLVCAANPEIQAVTCPASATGTFPFGAVTYAYDSNGNLKTKTAPAPNQPHAGTATVTTMYTYDVLNRLTGKSYSDGYNGNLTSGVTYGYDGVLLSCPTPIGQAGGGAAKNVFGRRTAMCYSVGSKSWIYDSMGRAKNSDARFVGLTPPYGATVVTINGVPTISANVNYNYDLNGDLAQVFYPQPGIPNYEFYTGENAAGRVTSAGDIYNNVLERGTYAPHGALATALVGRGTYAGSTISNTYNNRLQPVVLSVSTATNTPILNLTYNFNLGNGTSGSDNGNVIQTANGKDDNRTLNVTYDGLNRIQTAYTNGPNWGEVYTIDAWGNLTNRGPVTGKANSEPLACAAANIQNQLITCFTYDAAGNLIQNGSITYTYDAENQLISTGGYSYIYDGDGQRVEKCTKGTMAGTCATNASGIFYWKLADGSTLAESDLGGNWTAAYGLIHGQIASRVDLPSKAVHYYFHDHLGSTSIVTDGSGNILKESDYYPYGGEIPITGSDTNRYRFTGKERDAESGLDDFGARYYGSTMGRFMVPDKPFNDQSPRDPQSWNLYSFVRNNPLRFTDPTGDACVQDANGNWNNDNSGGESCAQVDVNNATTGPSVTVQATTDDVSYQLASGVANLTTTSSLSEVGVNASFWAGLADLPFAARDVLALLRSGRAAGDMIGGMFGQVSRASLEAAANSGGETIRAVCTLDGAPAAGRALSAATGQGADALANAAGGGTKYVANIPKALVQTMEKAGLVTRSTTSMGSAVATELRFTPQATEFVVQFFRAVH